MSSNDGRQKIPPAWESLRGESVLAIKHVICFTCSKNSTNLDKCSACLRVSYCCKGCQTKDWKAGGHKALCKILVTLNNRKGGTSAHGRTWAGFEAEKFQDAISLNIDVFSKKRPDTAIQFVNYEPFCRRCFRRRSQLYPGEVLTACETCHLEFYCSTCGQQEHAEECEEFQLFHQDQLFLTHTVGNDIPGESMAPENGLITKHPLKVYEPISTLANWYDYYTRIVPMDHLGSWVTPSWMLKVQDTGAINTVGFVRLSSCETTAVLTILAALEAAIPDLASKTTIRLHLIGAEDTEFVMLGLVEEILHMLPALKELKLLLIGPELPADQIDECRALENSGINEITCCPECTFTKRRITFSLWEGLYHDYLDTSSYTKPDLAVAFNPGWTYVKTIAGWLPTVARLTEAAHATLFTSYNQAEVKKETLQMIFRFPNVRFIQKAEVNKWKAMSANLTPLFMPETPPTKENRFLTKNRYWYIFTGSRESVLA